MVLRTSINVTRRHHSEKKKKDLYKMTDCESELTRIASTSASVISLAFGLQNRSGASQNSENDAAPLPLSDLVSEASNFFNSENLCCSSTGAAGCAWGVLGAVRDELKTTEGEGRAAYLMGRHAFRGI
jgi:hypothetical protein